MENLPATQRDMVSLNRELEVDQQIYMQLSNKLQELDVVRAGRSEMHAFWMRLKCYRIQAF
ncbi:non-specific protein-tyrosine kinase [Actinobacillus equuli]|nr:non-specific protein-tyrosine kinase [Actinobacillus equuli]